MKRNRAVQLSLIATAIILFIFTYFYSADKDRVVDIDKNVSAKNSSKLTDETSNITENVNYVGTSGGALFELNAAIAEIKKDEPDIISLWNVSLNCTYRPSERLYLIHKGDASLFS